jgi:hypothetical protein
MISSGKKVAGDAISVGSRVWFEEEKRPYKVRALNDRFVVLTKPFNLSKTYLYTIIDLTEGIRGTDGYVFSIHDLSKEDECIRCVSDLQKRADRDGWGVSQRNRLPLKISRIR